MRKYGCSIVLILSLIPVAATQGIPKELWGRWIVKRMLPATTISCWGQEEVDNFIGTELEYSADLFRWKNVRTQHPRIQIESMNAEQFHDFHSGHGENGSHVTFKQLGISGNSVRIIRIDHPDAEITGGTTEIPGDYVLVKDTETIIFPVCNVWFEAKRLVNKK